MECQGCAREPIAWTCVSCGGIRLGHACRATHEAQGHTILVGVYPAGESKPKDKEKHKP